MIEVICSIPIALKTENRSVRDLVERSGYPETGGLLIGEALVTYLREHPELIDAWLGYSSDKRASSGWYFRGAGTGEFEVGYFPSGDVRLYTDAALACADFIAEELRQVVGYAG